MSTIQENDDKRRKSGIKERFECDECGTIWKETFLEYEGHNCNCVSCGSSAIYENITD